MWQKTGFKTASDIQHQDVSVYYYYEMSRSYTLFLFVREAQIGNTAGSDAVNMYADRKTCMCQSALLVLPEAA